MPLTESAHAPRCTYRLQLHGRFTFNDLAGLIPYFRSLGVSDFYLSPIFTATPGSLHGYDVTDYGTVNPELGGGDGFDLLATRLRQENFNLLVDFVPNHMWIAGVLNQWWRDVLENGRLSPYEPFFDIQWKEEGRDHPRVLVPLLEDHYGKVLEKGGITLTYTDEFALHCGDVTLPVCPESSVRILEALGAPDGPGGDLPTLAPVLAIYAGLARSQPAADPEALRKRAEVIARLKQETAAAIAADPLLQDRLALRLQAINGTVGQPESFDALHALIEQQHYRLARWQTGAHEINYRRFFAIDSLVGLHMEKPEVFRACHELLGRFVREGKVAGLRIDHIDGLRQPEAYLRRLQSLERPDGSQPLYVLVEKILAAGETLPESWPVQGTTGYEFIPQLASVLVDPETEARFDEIYRKFTGETATYAQMVYEKKRMIITELFVNAVGNLGSELVEIVSADRRWRDLTRHELTTAASEIIASLPVYRTYRRRQESVSAADRHVLEFACAQAVARNPRLDPQAFEFVRDLLVGSYPEAAAAEDYRSRLLHWVLTFQQYTGAVMAKAVEDTAFYTYNRLIALNEVGGWPDHFGGSVDGFHAANAERLATSPLTLLATSTHDTKLSEDVRARLYALSELPDEWEAWLREWSTLTARHTTLLEGSPAPDALDAYRFYQILLGAWPLEPGEMDATFRARLREHFRKAVNEAKRHTSILQANDAYLAACDRFVDGITHPETAPDFLAAFVPCAQRLARFGMVNSLAQLVLKCAVPGIPDFYQGNELWDFSLVDPDNRREIDYARRRQALDRIENETPAGLLENWRDGHIKLFVMQRLLQLRALHPQLFARGEYRPVATAGAFASKVVAFTRTHATHSILVVVPRLTVKLGSPPLGLCWDDTRLELPALQSDWRDVCTGRLVSAAEPLLLRTLLAELPFAVLQKIDAPAQFPS